MKLIQATEQNVAINDCVILKSMADPAQFRVPQTVDELVARNSKRVVLFKRADKDLEEHRRRYWNSDTKEGDFLIGVFQDGGTSYYGPDQLWKIIY